MHHDIWLKAVYRICICTLDHRPCHQKRNKVHPPMSVVFAAKLSLPRTKLYSVLVAVSSGCTATVPAFLNNSRTFFVKTKPVSLPLLLLRTINTRGKSRNWRPCRNLKVEPNKQNLPCLIKTIIQLIKMRNYYFKKACCSGSSVDYSKFKQLRNKVVTELWLAKRRFFSNLRPQNPKHSGKL